VVVAGDAELVGGAGVVDGAASGAAVLGAAVARGESAVLLVALAGATEAREPNAVIAWLLVERAL
jgi:hypothetical protein